MSARRFFPFTMAVGMAGLFLAGAIGFAFFLHKNQMPRSVAPPSLTSDKPTTSPQSAGVLLPTSRVFPSSTASPRAEDWQILRNASREELLALARSLLEKGRPLADIISLLEYLTTSKPEFAIDLARDIGRTDGERHVLLYAVLSDWAQNDAPTALEWAFRKSDAYNVPGNASLLYVVLEQVAGDDPRAVVTAAENAIRPNSGSLSSASASEVARFTIEALIRTGRGDLAQQAVERWARAPEATRLDGTVYEVVAMSLAQNSLAGAALWLQSLPCSPARDQALPAIAATWSQKDARAAMDWAQSLNAADGSDEVRIATFESWLKSDQPAAAQWLSFHETLDNTRLVSLLKRQVATD